jgi:hypothetical protein
MVAGPCNEAVLIQNRQRITFQPLLDGFGVTIVSPDPNTNAMRVLGSTGIVFIQVGFANGFNGLLIDRSSEVQVLGCTITGNAANGVVVRGGSVARVANGFIQNNAGRGINATSGSNLTVDSSPVIESNGGGIGVVFGSSARIFAPVSISNNTGSGLTVGSASAVQLFGDPDTPSPVIIQGNGLIGINTFGGQVVMSGPISIRNNGLSGGQFHAGLRSDDNSLVATDGTGVVDISNNFGPGIEATNGGALDLAGTTINNNTEDGIRLLGNSQLAVLPANTNVIAGNGGRSILCDNSSWFFGDFTGLHGVQCQLAELRGRTRHTPLAGSFRDERPAPYVFRSRKP